jgi:serine/threonine-protein kinase PknK
VSTNSTRVVLADDEVLMREGLAGLLERAGFEMVALVQELVAARGVEDPLDVLSPREREVLALMAEGRSNAGIAHTLWITESTVEKHVRAILRKLRLPAGEDDQRRVLAVVTYLNAR